MVNKSGRIGREGEHKTNAFLEAAGFTNVEREGRRAPSRDHLADDLTIPVETKRQDRWSIPAWIKKVLGVHGTISALFVHPRDARRKDAPPSVMVVEAGFGAQLLKLYELFKDDELWVSNGWWAYGECNHDPLKSSYFTDLAEADQETQPV